MALFQLPYGNGNGYEDPYDNGAAPYGNGAAPYGNGTAPYGGAQWGQRAPPPLQPPQDPYGNRQRERPYGASWGSPPPEPKPKPYGGWGGHDPYGAPPAKEKPQNANPFSSLLPSKFPPGTDRNIVACFQAADQDSNGFIDDRELKSALSTYNKSFSLRTIRLLMYLFTNSNSRMMGPKEFTYLFNCLQNWRVIFQRFDRNRSGDIDATELREALLSLGYSVSPTVLELLISKYDKTGGKNMAIDFDKFIECCLTVKGLVDKFKEKDTASNGWATFSLDNFMLTVLPFVIA